MKVYLSGPISGLSSDEAREAFARASLATLLGGHEPINPFDIPPPPNCSCLGAEGHSWACCLRGDLAVLIECDAIYMLPGWERSHGARLELSVAAAVGLKVFGVGNA